MASSITEKFLQDQLEDVDYGFDENDADKILGKLNHLKQMYSQAPETLLDELIAFMMNKKQRTVTVDFLNVFDEDCLAKKLSTKPKAAPGGISRMRASMLEAAGHVAPFTERTSDVLGMYGADTPAFDDAKLLATPSANNPVIPGNRKVMPMSHKGKFFKGNAAKRSTAVRVDLLNGDAVQGFYGNEKIVDVIQTDIEESGYFPEEKIDPENAEESIVGYIFKEAGAERLTDDNACIRTHNSIKKLNLSSLNEYSIYPGQRIKFKGGENGDVFNVSSVAPRSNISLPELKLPADTASLSCMIACGPFMGNKQHTVANLCSLVEEAVSTADLLILLGPFMHREAEAYFSPECPGTAEELFEAFLLEVDARLKGSNLKVIIVPSCQKDLGAMPFYPTPAFKPSDNLTRRLSPNIMLFPDPSVVEIDGVRFALCNAEVIAKLSGCELHKSEDSENEDRMRRLYSHLFQAHSLYPLHQSGHIAVNMKNQKGFEIRNTPHVLIAPSILSPHMKVVNGCVCVNPGVYYRGVQRSHVKIEVDIAALTRVGRTQNVSVAQYSRVDFIRDSTK
ncbi:hypothetical protein QR680_012246 [Steinernema hermaphroditum]|uniref:DNA polymerase alpha subunit B n=1 Tax=Steinernema hermaphroditum TaxID=289476 RepID=A0AA39I2R6_9BILA|nr:hypothetical protein QR680_012246 [Steinernema hermaphroditum]